MTLTSKPVKLRGLRAIRFRAVIYPSKKLGIPRRYQKTWSVKCARPDLEEWQLMIAASREASRWEKKVFEHVEAERERLKNLGNAVHELHALATEPPML